MGTDCGLAILKEGEIRTVSLDRYYVFNGATDELRWHTKQELEDLLIDCYIENVERYSYSENDIDKPSIAYAIYWLNLVQNEMEKDTEAMYCIYSEHQEIEDIK